MVAPRFTELSDEPPARWITWNGSGYGDWRKGGNSTLFGGGSGAVGQQQQQQQRRPSLSSYAVLDQFVALLADKHLYPALKHVVRVCLDDYIIL
eukprot:COSAG01_NODE_2666_length_7293_cov_6.078592_2_plen_94_part_00